MLDINATSGKTLIDELNNKYGKGKVILIIADVTNPQNFEGK